MAALAAVAAGGVVTWTVLDDPPYEAGTRGPRAPEARPAAAAALLQDLASALNDGDVSSAARLAAPGGDSERQLGAVTRNARALGLSVSLRYVDEDGAVASDGSWTAAVAATWRYTGDSGADPAQAEVGVRFTQAADRVAIAALGVPRAGRVPVWLAGPVVVRSAPDVLVVVSGEGALGRSQAARYRRLASTAVAVVRRVLPAWHGPLVVEVPASAAALDRAMDVDEGDTGGIAAVTVPVDGASDTDSPVHVLINPGVFEQLQPTGAQVVLSHEAVHVATDAARSAVAPWLVEGFADYVALRDVDLPVTETAAQVIAEVRRKGVPDTLPGPSDFASGSAHLGATYEAAWLACVLVADEAGEEALVRLYRAVSEGAPLAETMQQTTGLTEAELTRRWQQRLRALAGRRPTG